MTTTVAKAVILLGGPSKGTRFRPLSMDIPKPLFPIAGRPLVWHSLQALSKVHGLRDVVLIGFYDDSVVAPFIKDAHKDFPNLSITYLREYKSLGTAGGLYHFRDIILKGSPDQIFVLHADVACYYPLSEIQAFHLTHRGVGTVMGVKVSPDIANKFGSIVVDAQTSQARHYVEKPEAFISDIINGGIYLFDKSIFDEIRSSIDLKAKREAENVLVEKTDDDYLRLEQDVLVPLASSNKLYVYQYRSAWVQIKSGASALEANSLILDSYKTTNPLLLRHRSPTIIAKSRADYKAKNAKPTILEPCFIDETAEVDPTARIGPHVSIGPNVKVGFGVRIIDAIILDNTVIDKNACILHSIISEDCKVGPWSRIEGEEKPAPNDKIAVSILAKEVTVLKDVYIRNCVVLPHKEISKSVKKEIIL